MLVSKARFIYYLQKYKDAYEEQRRFHDALRPFFDFPVCTYQDDLFNSYESMLVAISECEDEDDIFSWWVENHPNDDKRIIVKDISTGEEVVYDVESIEGLYSYLYDVYHNEEVNDGNTEK